ncbi:MAG TPA: tRNA pseudouridine(55) synthase TruB [Lachnospiraceae bacterium]|nr:tRNA pseudouridine(55) synthase TruB [Lachnospiraceae bacterium]
MYDGIVNVYKEAGYTSHDVVAKLRGIYGQKKVGHTGTLDPMAEGVLIVVLGRATKLADMIITKRKKYIARMQLGLETDTDDISGKVVLESDRAELEHLLSDEEMLEEKVKEVFRSFMGKNEQIPPMYSAIKVNGKKLYEYAREGVKVELTPRPIEIYSLELSDIDVVNRTVSFEVEASKGTYIRSLIRDMGRMLGCGATMSGLLRSEINGIYMSDSLKITDIEKLREEGKLGDSIQPMDALLSRFPEAHVKKESERFLANGNRLRLGSFEEDNDASLKKAEFFRVYMGDEIKGLYTYDKENNNYKVFKML